MSGGLFGSFVDICGVFLLYSGDQFVILSIGISLFLSFCHCVFFCVSFFVTGKFGGERLVVASPAQPVS